MNNLTNWLLAVLIVVLLGMGAWQVYAYQNPKNNNTATTTTTDQNNTTANPTAEPEPTGSLATPVNDKDWTKGPANAKIQLVTYEDYQCPACRQLGPVFESMVDKYPGQVSFTFRHFPLSFHPFAMPAAHVSEAAGAQGKFWEMHDFLMKDDKMTLESAYEFAKTIGLDADKLKADVDAKTFESKINGMTKDGESSGVQGTPSLFLNGKLLSWQNTTDIENTIKNNLK